jgi:hypothetical protein
VKKLALLTLLVTAPHVASAECAPERMVRVVFRDATPGLDPGSFEAQPKTLYRLGSRYGRMEEMPDPKQGIHGLIVVDEPDIWMINLGTKTGQHIVDKGEPYHFHASILGGPDSPGFVRDFEFGCELAYMKERSISPEIVPIETRKLESYRVSDGSVTLTLAFDPTIKKPAIAALYENGKLVTFLKYLSYDNNLEPDLSLFKVPPGIELTEAE